MNVLSLKSWSERQQVVAVILMAGALMSALWFFLLIPLNHRRARLEMDINEMSTQLAHKNYLLGESTLEQKKSEEEQFNRTLKNEWDATVARIGSFPNAGITPKAAVGNIIDYKVALFDVRHRLLQKSREMNVSLPLGLGLDETVQSNADARKRMLQLRTVEKLVDLALNLKIDMLRQIQPLDPVTHSFGADGQAYLEEFPVQVDFFGSRDDVYALLRAIAAPEHVFALRRMRIEALPRMKAGVLSVKAELSALVFLKSPEEFNLALPESKQRSGPKGG